MTNPVQEAIARLLVLAVKWCDRDHHDWQEVEDLISTIEAGPQYSNTKPTETGWYYHRNGRGRDEIVELTFEWGSFWVNKPGKMGYPLSDDKGQFGPRIPLTGEGE